MENWGYIRTNKVALRKLYVAVHFANILDMILY